MGDAAVLSHIGTRILKEHYESIGLRADLYFDRPFMKSAPEDRGSAFLRRTQEKRNGLARHAGLYRSYHLKPEINGMILAFASGTGMQDKRPMSRELIPSAQQRMLLGLGHALRGVNIQTCGLKTPRHIEGNVGPFIVRGKCREEMN